MNTFFKPKQTIFFFILCGLAIFALFVRYAKLAVQPVKPIAQAKTTVERGSIVDRSGFPLAVQTNFYHVGVSVKNIKDNEKLQQRFAQDVAPVLDLNIETILTTLNTNRSFVYLKKKIPQSTYELLKEITD